MQRDTNTSRTLSASATIGVICVALSLVVSLFAAAIFSVLIFDEMHIISTDHQLQVGLTLWQVTKDIFVAFNIWALCAALLIAIIGAIFYVVIKGVKLQIRQSTHCFAFRLAFACWLVLCSGPLLAAIQYYLEMRRRLD